MEPLYQESHTIVPKNLTILLAAMLAATLIAMVVTKFTYYQDMHDWMIVIAGVLFVIAVVICIMARFGFSIDSEGVHFAYCFRKTTIPMDQIIDTRTGELSIIKNYAGWNLKGVRYKTYSVMGLDYGVGIKVTGKRVFYFSTEDMDAVAVLLPKEAKE